MYNTTNILYYSSKIKINLFNKKYNFNQDFPSIINYDTF